ncbi:hypothetical protein ABQE73_09675 [Xanthomonas campestris pv. campestris]|uniref:Shikimate kinase n=1 Tax=Xanthomonas campestris pv. campestris (strain ATCC 33913 / DSM 3586 / NCPPB 528 / LMG 568 / P 25) TaxID=190485 RepID=Q8P6G2_XANCP|nr:hypothetical protein [Xanthomonas campestris]AAM42279.1 conserved hypothetical protein [Xanthomonas campestris pv. campestris str. ATCC 33913]MCC5075687.1 hypothetical protein [Xanthomonas campestris pv. campestris]MDM7702360.1 hypothetical protein [Xanthomonas campestris pv. campestris]MEA0907794.1 hypothetical protein [Xanthomonas campestris pv. campestris]MEB1048198.1 hypothetical protein [Xanthomonas campestris pv. campestris]
MAESIVVYGPMASGKSLNAEAICQAYGLKRVVELDERLQRKGEDWQLSQNDVVMLTNDQALAERTAQRMRVKTVAITEARLRVGAAWRALR